MVEKNNENLEKEEITLDELDNEVTLDELEEEVEIMQRYF